MKNSTQGHYQAKPTFQDESDASTAWESYRRHLGPAAPRPDLEGLTRLAFCAGFLAARAGR